MVTCLVIGDLHFMKNNLQKMAEFTEKSIQQAKTLKPTFIVLLGDTLHDHGTVRIQPHNAAIKFIYELTRIAPVYLLIGNHDMITSKEFLTDETIFLPLKQWKNVTVVDHPILINIKDKQFVFCPYVSNGRFIEALNTLGECWELADCIFGHQEMRGCKMSKGISTDGDEWSPDFPPLVLGHIHENQIYDNIYYPGSALPTAGYEGRKRIWFLTFKEENFDIREIDLKVRSITQMVFSVKGVDDFDTTIQKEYDVKIKIQGTAEEIYAFKKSKKKKELEGLGIALDYIQLSKEKKCDGRNFREILAELVLETKDKRVMEVHSELFE